MKTFITLFVYLAFLCGNVLAQDAPLILKFGLFADAQYADCPSENTRFYRETLQKWILVSVTSIGRMWSLQLIWGYCR